MAPEIEKREEYDCKAADIFAAGVVLFDMIFFPNSPFDSAIANDSYYKYFYQNKIKVFWGCHERVRPKTVVSESFKELVGRMFSINQSDRPSIEEIKESEWYKGELPTEEEIQEEFKNRQEKNNEIMELKVQYKQNFEYGATVHRSLGEDDDIDIDFNQMKLKVLTSNIARCTRFFIKDSAENVFRRLIDYQNKFASKIEPLNDEYTMLIHLKEPNNIVIRVNILKVEDEEIHCVEVIKEFGERAKFYEAYSTLYRFL